MEAKRREQQEEEPRPLFRPFFRYWGCEWLEEAELDHFLNTFYRKEQKNMDNILKRIPIGFSERNPSEGTYDQFLEFLKLKEEGEKGLTDDDKKWDLRNRPFVIPMHIGREWERRRREGRETPLERRSREEKERLLTEMRNEYLSAMEHASCAFIDTRNYIP